MHRFQALQADNFIELRQYAVKVADDIIAAVKNMTGIKANAHLFVKLHPAQNRRQLLKAAANLRALACHSFQQNRGMQILVQHTVEQRRYFFYANLSSLLHMAAGMKIIHIPRHIFQHRQIALHHHLRKLQQLFVRCTGVHRIRCVCQKRRKIVLTHQRIQRRRVLGLHSLRLASARIARKKLKRIGTDRQRRFSHRQKALR